RNVTGVQTCALPIIKLATGSKLRNHWAMNTRATAATTTMPNVMNILRNLEGSLTTSFSTVLVAAGCSAGGGVTTSGMVTSGSGAGSAGRVAAGVGVGTDSGVDSVWAAAGATAPG